MGETGGRGRTSFGWTLGFSVLLTCLHVGLAYWTIATSPTFGTTWQWISLSSTFFWVPPSLALAVFSARAGGVMLALGAGVATIVSVAEFSFMVGRGLRQGGVSVVPSAPGLLVFLLVVAGPMVLLARRLLREA